MQDEKESASARAGAFEQPKVELNEKSLHLAGSNLARHMPHVDVVTPLVPKSSSEGLGTGQGNIDAWRSVL